MVKSSPSESNRGRNKELSVRKKNKQAPKQEIRERTQPGKVRKNASWGYRGFFFVCVCVCQGCYTLAVRGYIMDTGYTLFRACLYLLQKERLFELFSFVSIKPHEADCSPDNSSRKEITLLSARSELKPCHIFAVILWRRYRGVRVEQERFPGKVSVGLT